MTIREIIRRSFAIYGNAFFPLWLISALPYFLSYLVTVFRDYLESAEGLNAAISYFLFFAAIIFSWIVSILAAAIFVHFSFQKISGQDPTIRDSMRTALGKSWPLLTTSALFAVILGAPISVLALIGYTAWTSLKQVLDPSLLIGFGVLTASAALVFFVWGLLQLLFIQPIVVLEGVNNAACLRRSRDLARGHLRRLLTIFALTAFLTGVVILGSSPLGKSFKAAVENLGMSLIYPFNVIALTLLYYDIRSRKEGMHADSDHAGIGDGTEHGSSTTGF